MPPVEDPTGEPRRPEDAAVAVDSGPEGRSRLFAAVEALDLHDHLCLVHESRQEQLDALVPFLRAGLRRRERCVCAADEDSAAALLRALAASGEDVDALVRSGALVPVTAPGPYLRDGTFDPGRMIAFLRELTDQALSSGFRALRVTGEMTWALGAAPGAERLLEYEVKLGGFFAQSPALAICQYDRTRFPPEIVRDVLLTHPKVVVGGRVCRNPSHVPPAELLSPRSPAQEVDRLLEQMMTQDASEEALRRHEALLRGVLEALPVGVRIVDATGRTLELNPAARRILGGDAPRVRSLRSGAELPAGERPLDRALRSGLATLEEEIEIETPPGERRVVLESAVPVRGEGGAVVAAVAVDQDVTARLQAYRRVHQLNRLLATLLKINQGIARETDRDRILSETCRVLVDDARFRMAWIGLVRPDGRVEPVAHSGAEDGYLREVEVRCDDSPRGRGPSGMALAGGRPAVVGDIATDPAFEPWREAALRRGYRSCGAFPIRVGEAVTGVVVVFRGEAGALDVDEAGVLTRLASDLGFALGALEDRAERLRAERALFEKNELLERVFECMQPKLAFMDTAFRFLRVNRAYAIADGREPDFFVGRSHFELYPDPRNEALFRHVADTGEPYFATARPFVYAEHPERGVTYWDLSLVPVREADGWIRGLLLCLVDVTARERALREVRLQGGR